MSFMMIKTFAYSDISPSGGDVFLFIKGFNECWQDFSILLILVKGKAS
jgi:hypothetical protein